MKNIFSKIIAISLALIFVLVGCASSQEQQKKFKLETNELKIVATYFAKGDKVYKQEAQSEVYYAASGLESKAQAEELLAERVKPITDVKGVTHKVEFLEDKLVETMIIMYDELDYEKAVNYPAIGVTEENAKRGVSLKASEELLTQSGFVVEE